MASGYDAFAAGMPLTNGHPETPEERDLRLRAETFRERMNRAIESADRAFWDRITTEFSETGTGDFPFSEIQEWDNAMGKAVYAWILMNMPEKKEILARIMKR
jgi:hypothetical protein